MILATLDASEGIIFGGVAQYDYTRTSVSISGDINGDGLADIAIGAPRADSQFSAYNSGSAFVVFGLDPTGALVKGNAGVDDVTGGSLTDKIFGAGGDDILRGRDGDDELIGGDGVDTLLGQNGGDVLTGGDGNDKLNGGAGIDTMIGGDGNDLYTVDNSSDVVTELAGEGTLDRVNVLADFVNPLEIEFLVGKFAAVGLTLERIERQLNH